MENSTRRVSTPLKGCGFAAEDFIKYTALSAVEIPQDLREIMIGDKFYGFDGTKYTVEKIEPDSSLKTVYEVEETEIARYPQEEKAKRIFEDWVRIVHDDVFAW